MVGNLFAILSSISIVYAVITGNLEGMTAELFDGAGRAVTVLLSLIGMMCLWNAVLSALSAGGILRGLTRLLSPLLHFLFPHAKDAEGEISSNIAANLLGMGNAATPFALSAMQSLGRDCENGVASDETILFAVMNCSAFCLLPTTVLSLRAAGGSKQATAILPAIWLISLLCTLFSVIVCRIMSKLCKKRGK